MPASPAAATLDDQPEDNWERLKKCIVEAAEECLGRARKRQPDWFLDATDALMPLVAEERGELDVGSCTTTTLPLRRSLGSIRGL